MHNLGIYIALEGIDGSGKTTLANNITHYLNEMDIPFLLTKEPGGSQLGKKIRELLHTQPVPITPLAEFLLFAADRAQHFSEVIFPALNKGVLVLSDRSGDSSLAYQGYGRGVDKEMIKAVNKWAMRSKQPDYIIFVDVPVEVAINRYHNRGSLSKFEAEQADFFERIAFGFQELYQEKENVLKIDGTQSQEKMLEQVLHYFEEQEIIPKNYSIPSEQSLTNEL